LKSPHGKEQNRKTTQSRNGKKLDTKENRSNSQKKNNSRMNASRILTQNVQDYHKKMTPSLNKSSTK
jgi:hypothetical protein